MGVMLTIEGLEASVEGKAVRKDVGLERLLTCIMPDGVHVLLGGRIVRSGGPELALELEAKGGGELQQAA